MRYRIDQPCQQATIVGEDVAIVQCYRLSTARGEHVSHAVPDIAALAEFRWRQAGLLQTFINRLQARAVVPQYPMMLGQRREKRESVLVLRLGRAVEANHNLREVGN